MIATIFYIVFMATNDKEFSGSLLCLAIMADMANCMAICFVNGMIRSSIADAKIRVVQELNKGKAKCQD